MSSRRSKHMKADLLFNHKQYDKYTKSLWEKFLDLIFEEEQ